MSVIAVLLGFSMILAGCFLVAFLWAVRSGQYDDKHTPSIRILFDDPPPNATNAPPPVQRDEPSQHTSQ